MTLSQENVRAVREGLGWSRQRFAEALDVSVETVRSWEKGRRPCRGPSARLISMLDVTNEHEGDDDDAE